MSVPFKARASILQRVYDHLLFPLNMWLGEETSHRLGLTPIDHERVRMALAHCRGRLLDVACGSNLLVRAYGAGIGADIHPYPEISVRCDSDLLPFRTSSFDTVAMLACLNHITRRSETLDECHRVLAPGGRLILTMISPRVGWFSHRIRMRHDPDQLDRGLGPGEVPGMSTREIVKLLEAARFKLVLHRRFMWGLNNLYLAEIRQPWICGSADVRFIQDHRGAPGSESRQVRMREGPKTELGLRLRRSRLAGPVPESDRRTSAEERPGCIILP
ncbi:MAG: class I SAM-dependent methyltransferase [Acidobacteria bacterium]|nr:class I SAM-dependent methyltransferase [Acidobacteriota bacterium]